MIQEQRFDNLGAAVLSDVARHLQTCQCSKLGVADDMRKPCGDEEIRDWLAKA